MHCRDLCATGCMCVRPRSVCCRTRRNREGGRQNRGAGSDRSRSSGRHGSRGSSGQPAARSMCWSTTHFRGKHRCRFYLTPGSGGGYEESWSRPDCQHQLGRWSWTFADRHPGILLSQTRGLRAPSARRATILTAAAPNPLTRSHRPNPCPAPLTTTALPSTGSSLDLPVVIC